MATLQRPIEVVTAACLLCEDAIRLVISLACPSCEMHVDLREGCATNECREKTVRYEPTTVPAVAVNGVLVACCRRESITADRLIAAGIGWP